MGKKGKQILWILLALVVGSVLFFHQILWKEMVTFALRSYTRAWLGEAVAYDDLYWKRGRLVLVKPRIEKSALFSAEKLSIDYHFDFFHRELSLAVKLYQPHVNLEGSPAAQREKWGSLLKSSSGWIKLQPSVICREGVLHWKEGACQQTLLFDLETYQQTGGVAHLFFNEEKTQGISFHVAKNSKTTEIQCVLEDVKASSLVFWGEFLAKKNYPLLCSQGRIKGALQVSIEGHEAPWVQGELQAFDLFVENRLSSLEGRAENVRISIAKSALSQERPLWGLCACIDFLQPSSFWMKESGKKAGMEEVRGALSLDKEGQMQIDLQAKGRDFFASKECKLQGKLDLDALLNKKLAPQNHSYADIAFLFDSPQSLPEGNGSEIKVAATSRSNGLLVEVQMRDVSLFSSPLMYRSLASHAPILETLLFQKGELSGVCQLLFLEGVLKEVSLDNIEAKEVAFTLEPGPVHFEWEHIAATGSTDPAFAGWSEGLTARFACKGGRGEWRGQKIVDGIEAHLTIDKGAVQHSVLTAEIAGLKGKVDLEWKKDKKLATCRLEGMADSIADFLPQALQQNFRSHFSRQRLMILSNIKQEGQEVTLGGTLHIQRREGSEEMDLIHFASTILEKEIEGAVHYAPTGWFHAQSVAIEKFISPFVFRNQVAAMSGQAELKGSFDSDHVLIRYGASDLKIENDKFCITLPGSSSQVDRPLLGSHRVDLQSFDYEGTLPFEGGSYLEKNSALLFENIKGVASFREGKIFLSSLEATCEEMDFAGDLLLDYRDPAPGVFTVSLSCPYAYGTTKALQRLLAHFESSSLFCHLPLQGIVSAREKGLELNFDFFPGDYHLGAKVKGSISEGVLEIETTHGSLQGIYLDVEYDHQEKRLVCSDIQGSLLVGKPRRVQELQLIGKRFVFDDLEDPNIAFDLKIAHQEKEFVHLVGNVKEGEDGLKELEIDWGLSHLSALTPVPASIATFTSDKWRCSFKNFTTLESFDFACAFNLSSLLSDLLYFRHSGLFFLSPALLGKLSDGMPLEGLGFCTLHYDPREGLSYSLRINDLQGESKGPAHAFVLKGRKSEKKWMIEECEFDEWKASCEIEEKEEGWAIPFLGVKREQALLLGLEGFLSEEKGEFEGCLKFCQIDLNGCDGSLLMQPVIHKWWPKGFLTLSGRVVCQPFSAHFLENCQTSLQATLSHFSLRGCSIEVLHPFSLELSQGGSLYFKDLSLALNRHGKIECQHAEYSLPSGALTSVLADFRLEERELQNFCRLLQHHFPDCAPSFLQDEVSFLKKGEVLEGTLQFQPSQVDLPYLTLALRGGSYLWNEREWELGNPRIDFFDTHLLFHAFSKIERCPFEMKLQTFAPDYCRGFLEVVCANSKKPLLVQWEKKENRWILTSLLGEFSGLQFALKEGGEEKSDLLPLQGEVILHSEALSPLLTKSVAEELDFWNIQGAWSLKGKFWIDTQGCEDLASLLSFKAKLLSRDFSIKGCLFQSFEADLQYVKERLDIESMVINDPAGKLKVAAAVYQKEHFPQSEEMLWSFFIPSFSLQNFKPSQLRLATRDPFFSQKLRTLVVKKSEWENVRGWLGKKESWEGKGMVQFGHSIKKNPLYPLFVIPAEIILRLGLDPHVLNPVSGSIYFTLQDERLYLTRFKDVYSQGKGSKFHLTGPDPSWIDFDGNLKIALRMKQYNLFFKITELFTVSIQGNIKKPRYSLKKQPRASASGLR